MGHISVRHPVRARMMTCTAEACGQRGPSQCLGNASEPMAGLIYSAFRLRRHGGVRTVSMGQRLRRQRQNMTPEGSWHLGADAWRPNVWLPSPPLPLPRPLGTLWPAPPARWTAWRRWTPRSRRGSRSVRCPLRVPEAGSGATQHGSCKSTAIGVKWTPRSLRGSRSARYPLRVAGGVGAKRQSKWTRTGQPAER